MELSQAQIIDPHTRTVAGFSLDVDDETHGQLILAVEDSAKQNLMSDLRRMVNEDDISDVIFTCKDGKQVKAIRSLLMERCRVLKGMLANGMKETSLSEINLPNVPSQALLCVFEFLYTATVISYCPSAWRLQFEVVLAAQFFLLTDLVDIAKGLVRDKVLNVAKDLPEAAAMLTATLEFKTSLEDKAFGDAIITKLVECLSSDWTHSVYAASLSEEALHCLLSQDKVANQKGDEQSGESWKSEEALHCLLSQDKVANQKGDEQSGESWKSLTEYYRFRQIILWWVYQNKSGWSREAEEIVESAVPIIRYTSCLYADVGTMCNTAWCIHTKSSFPLNSCLTDHASRDSARRLLSIIDLRYIHPQLIAKMVEPLDCFSYFIIAGAFRFHALNQGRKSITFENFTCSWRHGKFLSSGAEGSAIVNCHRKLDNCDIGSAIFSMRMSNTKRIHLWRFLVDKVGSTKSVIEAGFVSSILDTLPAGNWDESSLDKVSLSSLPGARVLRISYTANSTSINWQDKGRYDWKVLNANIRRDSCILLQLDFKDHTCSLNLDGQDFGVCWKNLPDVNFYPAVCIGSSRRPYRRRIRIQTANVKDCDSVSDFD